MRRKDWMKYFIAISIISFFISPKIYAESLDPEEVVAYANQIMKNIYNDIWRIRSRYPQLKDFGPQNLSDTMELPPHYSKIKKIRIKSAESGLRRRFFREEEFTGDKDTIYISFSETPKVYGTTAIPAGGVKVADLDLYILVYSNSEDQFFKHDMISIIKQDAVVTEQVSY
ncbi:MAG: hypothetical protein PHT53_06800 [Candidatus Omnitrophica bacterium]|nr:hypothetical protein [Candidatus Omnitrophota bacterium]